MGQHTREEYQKKVKIFRKPPFAVWVLLFIVTVWVIANFIHKNTEVEPLLLLILFTYVNIMVLWVDFRIPYCLEPNKISIKFYPLLLFGEYEFDRIELVDDCLNLYLNNKKYKEIKISKKNDFERISAFINHLKGEH